MRRLKSTTTFLIILLLYYTITFSSNLYTAEHSNRVMDCVVKSKKWKIDRKNNLEIFEGNVSLHGTNYDIICEHAIYYRNKKYWKLQNNITLTKFFDKERKIEAFGDYAEYFEEKKEMRINGIQNKVKAHYLQPPNIDVKAQSNKLVIDVNSSIATFYENFSITKEKLNAYSENAIYNQTEGSFLLFGGFPYVIGQYEKYNFAIKSNKIRINENKKTITFNDNVQGIIK